ncbi:MAG: hypothetical protein R3D98_12700 [Candidatus Krumholzibacteriia bacterium]
MAAYFLPEPYGWIVGGVMAAATLLLPLRLDVMQPVYQWLAVHPSATRSSSSSSSPSSRCRRCSPTTG